MLALVVGVFVVWLAVRHSLSAVAALRHIEVVLTLGLALQAARYFVVTLLDGRRLPKILGVGGYALFLTALVLYYILVAIGLTSWGRVISADLISTYLLDAIALSDVLGVPFAILPAAVGGLLAITFGLAWVCADNRAPKYVFPSTVAKKKCLALSLAAFGFFSIQIFDWWQFDIHAWAKLGEPIGLSIHPGSKEVRIQSNAIDLQRANAIDVDEDAARASYPARAAENRRNVVLIISDALRADHIKAYGYPRETTPHLSAYAAQGKLAVFPAVHTSCAESTCGLFSLASSKYTHEFSARPFTLQQALKKNGYEIHMVLGGDHTAFYGLREMYGPVDSYFDGSMVKKTYRNDDQLVLDRLEGLDTSSRGPKMLQIHLMSSHALGSRSKDIESFEPNSNYAINFSTTATQARAPEQKFTNFYDNGVLSADRTIARILEILSQKKYLENALVVITADHGDGLGEHGFFSHANSVFEEVIKVPLLVLSYGAPLPPLHQGVHSPAQIDIAPTILDNLNIEAPKTWRGKSLLSHPTRGLIHIQQNEYVGFIDRDNHALGKYWINSSTKEEYYYELANDPLETKNLIHKVDANQRAKWKFDALGLAQTVPN
ncbi:sulfatase-like hydrolase/transferase [Variovorax sp. J22R24]|uniref:sulfatase-like hydrolase/transferase n=1 Tax=Variovorax gracilis TaxID=3053502 RepID=UPI002578342A|nr:sulfatase-like hydrolase/transferase [Variovorax sp. J22R24]MDM0106017.1 sulfatase-like hydrolase/transferase [Variovorax sp. J22R24]